MLAQKRQHQNRMGEIPSSILTGDNILLLEIFISRRKVSDANVANFA